MARFYGIIGYAETVETAQDVYAEQITERAYFGDITRNVTKLENGEWLNDDVNVQNNISIVADAFAYEHFHAIRYVVWNKVKWKVRSVEVQHPRLILSIGGVHNDH